MDRQRDKFVKELERLRAACEKTDSKYLRNDYVKAIKDMERELRDYDMFKKSSNLNGRVAYVKGKTDITGTGK